MIQNLNKNVPTSIQENKVQMIDINIFSRYDGRSLINTEIAETINNVFMKKLFFGQFVKENRMGPFIVFSHYEIIRKELSNKNDSILRYIEKESDVERESIKWTQSIGINLQKYINLSAYLTKNNERTKSSVKSLEHVIELGKGEKAQVLSRFTLLYFLDEVKFKLLIEENRKTIVEIIKLIEFNGAGMEKLINDNVQNGIKICNEFINNIGKSKVILIEEDPVVIRKV